MHLLDKTIVRRLTAVVLLPAWLASSTTRAPAQDFTWSGADVVMDDYICPPSLNAIYADPGTGLTFIGKAYLQMAQPDQYGLPLYTYRFEGYTVDRHQKIVGFAHIAQSFCPAAFYSYLRGHTVPLAQLHNATLYQVACNDGAGAGANGITTVTYEYSSPYTSPENGDCSGSNDGAGPGGTYYQPGDHTGGETVDWTTGRGDGGTSLCGANAVVHYVCIDVWDGEKWVEWSCGYATSC